MSYDIVTRPHQDAFIEWAKDKPEVLVLSADLTNSCEVGKWLLSLSRTKSKAVTR